MQKGIDKELAQQLLENEEIDETSQIRELLEKKGLWGRTLERKEYEKTVGMLARRGYSFEVIHSVMADMQDSIWAD